MGVRELGEKHGSDRHEARGIEQKPHIVTHGHRLLRPRFNDDAARAGSEDKALARAEEMHLRHGEAQGGFGARNQPRTFGAEGDHGLRLVRSRMGHDPRSTLEATTPDLPFQTVRDAHEIRHEGIRGRK